MRGELLIDSIQKNIEENQLSHVLQFERDTGRVIFRLIHHKSALAQQGLMSGPVTPSVPQHALTSRLTTVVVKKVLPFLYRRMDGVPEGEPLPILPNVFDCRLDEPVRFKTFTQSSYSLAWQKVAMDQMSCMPRHGDSSHPLRSLDVIQHPFSPGPFVPSDNR